MAPLLDDFALDEGHVVQFYDSDADLIARAGDYLAQGLDADAAVVVIATEAHRRAFEARLPQAGEVLWLDAADTLAQFMRDGRIDKDAFFDVIGGVIRAAAASGRPVRAYGEMVALLWQAGDVMAAIDLETLWNELAAEVRFSLYCAYRRDSVEGHEHADRVCHLHTDVLPPPETSGEFAADAAAPARARRFVTDALRQAGHTRELLDDARIVITELAANAVRHARTPFSISIRHEHSRVRIAVRDKSPASPAMRDDAPTRPSGRGLRLVDAIATRWGVDRRSGEKVVWVEISARRAGGPASRKGSPDRGR